MMMEVVETDGKIWVANDQRRVGPFDTNAAAWSWIDKHNDQGLSDTERYGRIRMAFNGSLVPDRY
jgi:hypothetical protein